MSDISPTSEDERDQSANRFQDAASACVKSYLERRPFNWLWTTLVEDVAAQLGLTLEYEGVIFATACLQDLIAVPLPSVESIAPAV